MQTRVYRSLWDSLPATPGGRIPLVRAPSAGRPIQAVSTPATGRPFPAVSVAVRPAEIIETRRTRWVRKLEEEEKNAEDDDPILAFWDYQFLFVSQRSETERSLTLRLVEGSIPQDFPSGTYYLAGPGMFSDDHGSTVHPLDGHGYLRAFEVDGPRRRVRFSARYVSTEAQREERHEGTGRWKFTHRGPFSVLRGGKKLGNTKVMKNVANTSVLKWGPRLLCLWEGGNPHEVDPATLETVGEFRTAVDQSRPREQPLPSGAFRPDFRRLSPKSALTELAALFLKPFLHGIFKMPPKRMLSHYKIDPQRNRLLMMSCNAEDMLLPCSHFTIYEYDGNFNLLQKRDFNIPDHLMIHDWAFTDNHYILVGNRIKLDIAGSMKAVGGTSPMISALSLDDSSLKTPIYVLPRFSDDSTGNRDWTVPIEAPSQFWLLHVANAFEEREGSGNLEIHMQASTCSYQWFDFNKMFGYDWERSQLDPTFMNPRQDLLPHLTQVTIRFDRDGSCKGCVMHRVARWTKASDFPIVNPRISGRKNNYTYAATCSGYRLPLPHFPFDTVVKFNRGTKSAATWRAGRRRFIGEPIYVPKGKSEDDGYILVVEYAVSIQMCYLVILDARLIGRRSALVARLEVPREFNFPMGFHGVWAPA
ncbi:unnamed protein product [Victoria cruziana]